MKAEGSKFKVQVLEREQWRRCQWPAVRYEVSNLGRVRHARRRQLLQLIRTKNGYLRFDFRHLGEEKSDYVHRQVAHAFCDGYFEGAQVNHRNGIKTDNRAANLEWVTPSENALHKVYVLGIGVKPVALFHMNGHIAHVFPSAAECSRALGGNVAAHIIRGCRYHGFRPRYITLERYQQLSAERRAEG